MKDAACDELYISFLFPPSGYVSGITVFKRIAENGRAVDVLQADNSSKSSQLNEYVEEYINKRILIDIDCDVDWTDCIFKFTKRGLDAIEEDYERIYSRSWLMANHFLASEYKFAHPDVFWTAEFSDPLIFNLSNDVKYYKQMMIDNEEYIRKINEHISLLNEKNCTDFPLVENNVSAYYVAEYLTYLFADRIIFTNENQKIIMLKQFPVDVYDFVIEKTVVERHPTLDGKYYHLIDSDIDLDDDYINLAYFGKDYYGERHFESLFYALESLNHKFKDKIRIYLFIYDSALLRQLVNTLDSSDNFIVKEPLDYLEFLNATTKFDVLIVNDVITKGNYQINPYLPSKLSDYLGSESDIWALYEKGSSLSNFDVKYKSDILDFKECTNQLINILNDNGYADEDSEIDDKFYDRLTSLNQLVERLFRQNLKLKREVKKVKRENEEMMSSNSWKLTQPLRKLRNSKK